MELSGQVRSRKTAFPLSFVVIISQIRNVVIDETNIYGGLG